MKQYFLLIPFMFCTGAACAQGSDSAGATPVLSSTTGTVTGGTAGAQTRNAQSPAGNVMQQSNNHTSAADSISARPSAGGYSLQGGNVYGGAAPDMSSSGTSAATDSDASSAPLPDTGKSANALPNSRATPSSEATATGVSPAAADERTANENSAQRLSQTEKCRAYRKQMQASGASQGNAASDPCELSAQGAQGAITQ